MTPCEKVAQLLARSTPFVGERESAMRLARTLFNKPSYTREITTRPISFTCAWCQTTVTQQRFPGPVPAYCSAACKADAQREQTRERVRRFRERRR